MEKINGIGTHINEQSQGIEKIDTSFFDARKRTLFCITSAIVTALTAFDQNALAKITCEKKEPSDDLVLRYQGGTSDSDTFIKYTVIPGLSYYVPKKLYSPLFESIRSRDIKAKGVNYTIRDPETFRKFIENEIEQIRKEHPYYSPVNDLSKLDSGSVCELAAHIIYRNVRYEKTMQRADPNYDRKLDLRIDKLPLDDILIKEKRCVCRHAAALYEAIAREIVSMSDSPYLQNFYIDELVVDDINHAQNVVFELAEEPDHEVMGKSRSIPIEKQKNLTIRYAVIDITPKTSTKSFSIKDPLIGLLINANPDTNDNIRTVFESHTFPVFSAEDRREVLKWIVVFQVDGNISFPTLDVIFKSYEDEIAALRLKGDEKEEQQKRNELKNYILTVRGLLALHIEKIKKSIQIDDPFDRKGRTTSELQQEIKKTESYLLKLDSME